MIWFRLPVKYRAWWESKLCETYGCRGLATVLWAKHLAPVGHMPAANDHDHVRW